jgi:Rps23 Pro-64 3,4-dihydroxylase Tpa1-like proline 4-hydroxylase
MTDILKTHTELQAIAKANKQNYSSALPFPHIVFTDFFNPRMLDKVVEEFPDLSKTNAIKYDNANEKKLAGKGEYLLGDVTKTLVHFLNSQPFLEFLQELTGIKETLLPDPYLIGGGLHEIKAGGLLKVHADFNKHTLMHLDRRLNVLVYLNKDWEESYGGHFELWDAEMKAAVVKILPLFNTMAIFSTTDFSYHGHPDPLSCPADKSRKSLALYYYTNGRPESEIAGNAHGTLFKARVNNVADIVAIAPSNEKGKLLDRIIRNITPPLLMKLFAKKEKREL